MSSLGLCISPVSGKLKTPDWFVDSVAGNDGNSGKSPGAALQTLAGLAGSALASGQVIALKRGSHWRETIDLSAYNNLTIKPYGTGNRPIIDSSDIAANGSFAKTGGRVNVYEIDITPSWAGGGNDYVNVFEEGEHLARVADVATCDATAGSYALSAEGAGTVTLYVHASDSSDVTANGYLYEYTQRQTTLYLINSSGHNIQSLDLRRSLRTIGVLHLGTYCTVSDTYCRQGNKLGLVLKIGCRAINCTVEDCYYGAGAVTLFDLFDANADGDTITVINCTADGGDENAYAAAVGGHVDGAHQWGDFRVNGLTVTNCNTGVNLLDIATANLSNITYTGWAAATCRGISLSTNTDTVNLSDSTFTMDGGKMLGDTVGGGSTVSISDTTITFTSACNTAIIHCDRASDYTLYNVTFNDQVPDISAAIYLNNAGATFNGTYCTYNDPKWAYSFHADIAAGTGFVSDYNSFSEEAMRFTVEGSAHLTVTDYRTATGQDANSTVGAV